jgi:hypothetical protein
MICDLTGLDVANASLLDEATAAAKQWRWPSDLSGEAKAFFVDREVHPQTLAVLRTRAEPLGWNLIVGDPLADLDKASVRRAAAISGSPARCATCGRDRALRAKGALAIVAADLLALTLLPRPANSAPISRRIGAALWRADGLWRPHAAYMAVRDALKRSLPAASSGCRSIRGAAGLPAGAADPRAAYPPRKGDLQHLHRAGSAGRDRLYVCGLSRPGGTDPTSAAQSIAGQRPWRPDCRNAWIRAQSSVSSTR